MFMQKKRVHIEIFYLVRFSAVQITIFLYLVQIMQSYQLKWKFSNEKKFLQKQGRHKTKKDTKREGPKELIKQRK